MKESNELTLKKAGFVVIPSCFSQEQLRLLRGALSAAAEEDRCTGKAHMSRGGRYQRVWALLGRGDIFADLVQADRVLRVVTSILGQEVLLSNLSANMAYAPSKVLPSVPEFECSATESRTDSGWPDLLVAGPENVSVAIHADQGYIPPPWPYASAAVAVWMLDDFREDNGATRVIPGSHLTNGNPPRILRYEDTVAACGSAGSVLVMDGRLWHGTGVYRKTSKVKGPRRGILAYFVRPYLRAQENWFLSLHPDVVARRPTLRKLLGYEPYHSLGMVGGPSGKEQSTIL